MRVILTGLARCYRCDTPILVATLSTRDTPIHAGHTRIAAQSCRNFGLAMFPTAPKKALPGATYEPCFIASAISSMLTSRTGWPNDQ
jgi:hypothetical protein